MKICRLKIIKANISDNNSVIPQISYVSQNKLVKKPIDYELVKDFYNDEKIELIENTEEIIVSKENNNNNIKLQEIIKSDRDEKINEQNEENKKVIIEEKQLIEETNKIKEEEKANTLEIDVKISYPYAVINKKKDLNNSLKYIFKNRLTKGRIHSNKYSNLSLPKLRTSNLSIPKKKNNNSKTKLAKSVSNVINYNKIKYKNKNSKTIKTNMTNNLEESTSSAFWRILEKSDFNYKQNVVDYKTLIDELIIQECNLVKQKEELIQIYEEKIKSLKEINNNLMNNRNIILDREDELNGEFILLRNQYENLFRNIKPRFKSNENFNKQQNEIDEKMKKMNNQLKNGELILITEPKKIIKISKKENKYITYLLRGIFFSHHLLDTDKIVDLIWKSDKKIQTIYFLVTELINLFNLNKEDDQNILINYIYSFCRKSTYMHITEFKSKFKKKIGQIKIYNKYIHMSKMINTHKSEANTLIKLMLKKDICSTGIINFNLFKYLFIDFGVSQNITKEDQEEFLEFFIYLMKKNFELYINDTNINEQKEKIKNLSLLDLFYNNLNECIDEYNAKNISNPYKLMRQYMENNNLINAEKIFRPIIIPLNLIKKEGKDYIDEIVLNKYLRHLGIIKNYEKILVKTIEEDLVDINEFINDIYTKDLIEDINTYEENKEKVNNMIDDIFYTALNKT